MSHIYHDPLLVRLRAPFESGPVGVALDPEVPEPLGKLAEGLAAELKPDAALEGFALIVGAGAAGAVNEHMHSGMARRATHSLVA